MQYSTSLLFFLLLSFFSCKNKEDKTTDNQPSAQQKEQKPITVDGIIAREISVAGNLSTTGTILANDEVEIRSEISGKITAIYFNEGSNVNRGQLLVKLNDEDLQAQMKKLNIEIKLAEDKEARQKQLLTSTAVSKEEYETSLSNVNLLKANAEILRIQIEKTKITAPFSGIAGLKSVSQGAYINPNTVIASIQNIQPLKLEFTIPEKYNNLINKGGKVDFTVAGSNAVYKAVIYAKEPKMDPLTRTVKVRAGFPNPGGKLLPGSFADIQISVGEKVKVKLIPTVAYIPDINGARVFVCKGGVAVSMPVKSGNRTESQIQILEGINEGDTVITSGILQLKPKMPVNINIINPVQ
jgi:membrane fusion protein (multidrug efflux system)